MEKPLTIDMEHLHKVQRAIRKAGNIFSDEKVLINSLEDLIAKVQDDHALNSYCTMANHLKQRLKEVTQYLDTPQPDITQAIEDLTYSIDYLRLLTEEKKEE
jgi:phage host-nuclease inhibitor protein Gam